MLARGSRVRQAKLLFFAKLAEKALQTYERDGWGEFPTRIHPERREIRPTADRGPILLCVDTSGSMRGPRETVAKALALECMRAAREQERDCYVFAFAGAREVGHWLAYGVGCLHSWKGLRVCFKRVSVPNLEMLAISTVCTCAAYSLRDLLRTYAATGAAWLV